MTFEPRRAQRFTHNDAMLYESQLHPDTTCAIIPDRVFHHDAEAWAPSLCKRLDVPVVYTRLAHGPHLADTNPSQPAEWIEAQAIAHWGAETNEVAWVGSNRTLYWYDLSKIDPLAYAGMKFEVLRPALPYATAIMYDYLEKSRESWQRKAIAKLASVLRTNGHSKTEITNGRPAPDGDGRFYERTGIIWHNGNLLDALHELGATMSVAARVLILDLFKCGQYEREAKAVAAVLEGMGVKVYLCYGRTREDGEVTA